MCVCQMESKLRGSSSYCITWGCSSFGRLGCFDPKCVYPGDLLCLIDDNTTSQTQLMSSNNLTDDAHALTKPMNLVSPSLLAPRLKQNNDANVAEFHVFLCQILCDKHLD